MEVQIELEGSRMPQPVGSPALKGPIMCQRHRLLGPLVVEFVPVADRIVHRGQQQVGRRCRSAGAHTFGLRQVLASELNSQHQRLNNLTEQMLQVGPWLEFG